MGRFGLQRLPLVGTLLLHLLLFGLLLFQVNARPPAPVAPQAQPVEIVTASAVDGKQVVAELKRLKREKQQASDALRRQADEKRRRAEVQRQAQQEKQRQAEVARKAKAERLQQQERQAHEQQQAKRLAEQEKQRKIEADQRQRAEFERTQQEFEAAQRREDERLRQAAETALKAKLAAEEVALRQQRLATLQQAYIGQIGAKVQRAWIRPAGSGSHFDCRVLVNQLPTGEVVSVRVTRSCGTSALDRSVERAVLKASPLPRPSDPELFQREIVFEFTP